MCVVIVNLITYIALADAQKTYHEKWSEGKRSTALFEAGWTVEERQKLLQDHQEITVAINTLLGELENDGSDPDSIGVAHTLSKIRQSLTAFIRSLYRHKRTPATNVYVLMISNETRQAKPYALPIQLLPYASLNTNTMRRLLQDIVQSMTVRGMNVVGKSDNFYSQ